jgi:hypothetical protein
MERWTGREKRPGSADLKMITVCSVAHPQGQTLKFVFLVLPKKLSDCLEIENVLTLPYRPMRPYLYQSYKLLTLQAANDQQFQSICLRRRWGARWKPCFLC